MFMEERHNEILNILNREGKVIVNDLSKKFNVTKDCIRKDLKLLERKNLLKRTYGGAVSIRKAADFKKVDARKNFNIESKSIIAKKAFDLIENGDTVFLDISTTNIFLAKLISRCSKKLTVVTNMIDIISIINSEKNDIQIICPGGIICKDLNGFTGSTTIENISNYRFSKAFIGSCGVNILDSSVTTFDFEDGNTKKAIIRNSKVVYLVMENRKFYFDGNYKFATLDEIDAIITEDYPESNIINLLNKTNTKFI
ncbi:MAG: DeoR/GlpR transcriptional regulator [Clostridium sp.]|jgi:DeoR family transcriptional regulator, glycerol-3-phosphate regulon repressor